MSETVVEQASQYLHLMSVLAPPADLYFRSYATDGVPGLQELCDAAATMATGPDDAVASLVVAPGNVDAFHLDGAHARATLSVCHTPHTRLYVILGLLVALLVVVALLRQRGR